MVNNVSTRSFFYFNSLVTLGCNELSAQSIIFEVYIKFQSIYLVDYSRKNNRKAFFATDCVHFD